MLSHFRGFRIYQVGSTDTYVSLSEPASVRQVVSALKNEGTIRRNARYASFGVTVTNNGMIWLTKGDNLVVVLTPVAD